jgi:hypothetical protein
MENIFCSNLNLPVTLDLRELDRLKSINNEPTIWNHFLIDIDKNLNEFLKKYRLEICCSEAFYTPPNTTSFIHVDLDDPKYRPTDNTASKTKINCIFGAKGSHMQWFKTKNPGLVPQKKQTAFGEPYFLYNDDHCDLIYSTEVTLSIVEVSIPHNVINCTNEPRWCLSYMMYDPYQNILPAWVDVQERLQEFVVH